MSFQAEDLTDVGRFIRRLAIEALAKTNGLARGKCDKAYYEGQRIAYDNIASMIERGELTITGLRIPPGRGGKGGTA